MLKFHNMISKLLLLLILISLSVGDIGNGSIRYRVLVDGHYGFYRLSNEGTGEHLSYLNNTFNVNVGDKVVWVNEDLTDTITIISEQKLWEDNIGVLYAGKQFGYTFNNSGIYTFYIKQYNIFPKQTIIVSGNSTINNDTNIDINNDTNIDINNDTNIDTPNIVNINDGDISNDSSTIVENTNVPINVTIVNPILVPLNILKNIKIIGMITFIIIVTISFLRISDDE